MRALLILSSVLLLIVGLAVAQEPPSQTRADDRAPTDQLTQFSKTRGDPFAAGAADPASDRSVFNAATSADSSVPSSSESVSANPAAVNLITGTGALGRFLGIPEDSGIRLGGLWIGDASGILSGGRDPGEWGLTNLAIADLNLDTEKLFDWEGGQFGTEFLQFNGDPVNEFAGAFPGFNSLEASSPLNRSQLYQLWYRQSLFEDRLIVRVGKMVPTFDFNNVVKPVPVGDPAAAIPAVSGLIYTPVFVNPTLLGAIPGYYNSAYGVTTTFAPSKSLYLNYGFYDGNLARGVQTGLTGPHFNGYYFHIGEVGYAYRLGAEGKPGNIGAGVWGQTGKLRDFNGGITDGANGVYLFGTQRLWFRRPRVDNSGVSGFLQWGANDSNAMLARQYFGMGLTAFGLVPRRPDDSFGFGLAWTWLNQGANAGRVFFPDAPPGPLPLRDNQLMLASYYQMKLLDSAFLQTTLTEIPNPGQSDSLPNTLTLSMRLIVLF